MLHIMICDDEPAELELLRDYVEEWAAGCGGADIRCFQSAARFLFDWEEKKDADLLLLDIEMPGMNGMELARHLRRQGDPVQILFVTGLAGYAPEGYDVDAVSYLIKPVKKEQLSACLDKAVRRLGRQEPVLLVECAGELCKVPVSQILYLESMKHDTLLYVAGEEKPLRSKNGLSVLEKELVSLSTVFFKIHRSYLVHLEQIEKLTRRDVCMKGGAVLPIARGRWEELNQALLAHYRSRIPSDGQGGGL